MLRGFFAIVGLVIVGIERGGGIATHLIVRVIDQIILFVWRDRGIGGAVVLYFHKVEEFAIVVLTRCIPRGEVYSGLGRDGFLSLSVRRHTGVVVYTCADGVGDTRIYGGQRT